MPQSERVCKMDDRGLISVIVPVYNVRAYLEEALDSILLQSYRNLEIIIIDDGSIDGSGEICDDYAAKDDRVIVVHQENQGLSGARNVGLERMTGDLVAFLDPDDAYRKTYVEEMLSAMVHEGADLVISQYTVHYTDEKLTYQGNENPVPSLAQGSYDRVGALRALVENKINPGVWNKLYRRELWQEIRFPAGHVYEDVDVTYRILNLCRTIYALNRPLYLYRKRPGSISNTPTASNLRDRNLAFSHYLQFIDENTPAVFTVEQQKQAHNAQLNLMLSAFARYSGRAGIDSEALGKEAIALGRETGKYGMRLRTRMAYAMLCRCPWLLRAVYPMYCPVRLLINRVFGR